MRNDELLTELNRRLLLLASMLILNIGLSITALVLQWNQ